ncbi:MAG: NifU family protein [Cytophagales bacterium]|nr:MAG: NifU family protein [Cytophagales bacterium]
MTTTTSSELNQRVEEALNHIRPYLKTDGGDVRLLEITQEGIARLELLGTCVSCPMSSMTLKAGIEETIKKAVPEVTQVVAVNVAL